MIFCQYHCEHMLSSKMMEFFVIPWLFCCKINLAHITNKARFAIAFIPSMGIFTNPQNTFLAKNIKAETFCSIIKWFCCEDNKHIIDSMLRESWPICCGRFLHHCKPSIIFSPYERGIHLQAHCQFLDAYLNNASLITSLCLDSLYSNLAF